jgi:hypothetical protein
MKLLQDQSFAMHMNGQEHGLLSKIYTQTKCTQTYTYYKFSTKHIIQQNVHDSRTLFKKIGSKSKYHFAGSIHSLPNV